MNLYVHRIVVDSWPTQDGEPWARWYGPHAAAPNHIVPSWLSALIEESRPTWYLYRDPSRLGRIGQRVRWDDDRDEFAGILMPLPKRVHYLSASGVSELAADMRAFGAEVRILRSKPVEWEAS